MNGRRRFTSEEFAAIRGLLVDLRRAEPDEQKAIRRQLRDRFSFFISDFTGSREGFTASDLDVLLARGLVVIDDVAPDPPPAPAPGRVWLEEVLPRALDAQELRYVVVDELEDGRAEMLIEPWPTIDERGRPRFDRHRRTAVTVDVDALEGALAQRSVPDEQPALRLRPVRVGDAFAAISPDDLSSARALLRAELFDVSPAARGAAKLQFFASAGPVLPVEKAAGLTARRPGTP